MKTGNSKARRCGRGRGEAPKIGVRFNLTFPSSEARRGETMQKITREKWSEAPLGKGLRRRRDTEETGKTNRQKKKGGSGNQKKLLFKIHARLVRNE